MKILLISGHGAGDPGAVSKFGKEADLTIEQVEKIKPYLDKYADVTLYPTERNAYSDVKNGALKVKFSDYDYVLEVHFNSCVNDISGNGQTTGTEIYVTKAEATVGVETAIVKNIAALGLKNRGVKRTDFTVIKTAKNAGVSSALVEVCFIDDKDDMTIYNSKKDRIAQAIANGIISGFKLTATTSAQTSANTSSGKKILNACKNESEFLSLIAPLCQSDYAKHKILPSLSIAQACLESGYGTSDLFMYGAAAFGIKASSGWTGKVFRKASKEVINGTTVFQDSDFRAYSSLEESVSDHGEFLQKARYKAVVGETNFSKAASAIKAAGYATDPQYVSKLTSIYNKLGLSKYDTVVSGASGGSNTAGSAASGLSVGDTVTIKSGAVYGGLSSTRGKKVPAAQCGTKKHTVAEIETHKNVPEARLKEINSWVAVNSLTKTTAAKAISVGSKVTIKSGAVYGGLSSTRGKKVPAAQCGTKKHTVAEIETHKNVLEARLKEINSWVAVSSLNLV